MYQEGNKHMNNENTLSTHKNSIANAYLAIAKLRDLFHRPQHGSPMDRGRADAYYGRKHAPHWYPEGTYNGERITDLTPEQLAEYTFGYENEFDRKEW